MPDFSIADRCECGVEHSIGAASLADCTTHMATWWVAHKLTCTVERGRVAAAVREAEQATQLAARNAIRAEREAARAAARGAPVSP